MGTLRLDMDGPHELLLADADWVLRLARALVGDAGEARELAQETLAAAVERGGAPSRGWLAAVLRNRLRRAHRSKARREERERVAARPEALEPADELIARAERLKRAVALVLALEEPYRTTVLLRYLEELPPTAIAARQGVPVATVKTRLARALERLRREARDEHEDEEARPAWLVALAAVEPRGAALAGGALVTTKFNTAALVALAVALVAGLGTVALRAMGPRAAREEARAKPPLAERPPETALEPAPLDSGTERVAALPDDAPTAALAAATPDELRFLRGVVVDALDRPIAGARLEVFVDPAAGYTALFWAEPERIPGPRGESEADGRFALELSPGRPVELEVRAEGYAPVLLADCTAGQEARVVLRRGARLEGTLVSAEDGTPVAGGRVRVFHGEWTVEVPVDAAGRFQLDELVPGEVGLLALQGTTAGGRYTAFEVEPGGLLEARLEVARGFTVSGRVTDARSGAPIAGATVRTTAMGAVSATTDASGRYRLTGVEPERPVTLLATAAGFAGAQRLVDPARLDELDLALAPGVSARGRLVDAAGAPVAGAHVLAWEEFHEPRIEPDRATARSAPDGGFELEGLHPERGYTLLVQAFGFATRVDALPPLSGSDGALELGELRLEAPALLAGRVVDADGRGFAAGMTLSPSSDERGAFLRMRTFWTDADGRFALSELAPGSYTLRAWVDGRTLLEGLELELAPGEERTGLVLEVPRGLAIRGLVRDEAGRPVPGVAVWATREDGAHAYASGSEATTDARGWFALDGLAQGAHRVRAVRPEPWLDGALLDRAELREVEAGGAEIELVLRALDRTISGLVVDARGAPVPDALVWIERGDWREPVRCDAAGRFVLPLAGGEPRTLLARRSVHLAQTGDSTLQEYRLGRALAPAEDGEARLEGVLPGSTAVVLRLTTAAR